MRTPAACVGLIALGVGLSLATRPSGDVRTITVAVWGAEQEANEFRRRVAEPVEAAFGRIRLDVIYVPSDYFVKLSTLMAAGQTPDLFWLDQDRIPMYADLGALLDIAPLVAGDKDPVVALEDYYPQILASYWNRGSLIGLPWIAQPVMLYVNRRLFAEAGVDLPNRDWRWSDLVSAARRLTRDIDGDGAADQWGLALDAGWPPLAMFVWQNGGSLIGPDGRSLGLSSPATLEAARFWQGLIHRYRVAPPLYEVRRTGLAGLFRQERTAMYFGGAADAEDRAQDPRYPKDPDRRMPVRVCEVPAGPTGQRATFAWHAGLHISAKTPDPDLAYRVFKVMLERIQQWKIPAPRKSLVDRLEEFEPRKAAAAAAIRRSMRYMRPLRPIPRLAEWRTRYYESFLEPVATNRTSPAEAAARAEPRLREVMPR